MNASSFNKYIVLLAPYSIFVSTLYLLGYWGAFGINIFEYIGLGDIIKTAIYQLAHYGGFVLLGAFVTEAFFSPVMRKALPPGGGADLPEARIVRKFWRFYALAFVAWALYVALFTESEVRWFSAAVIIAPIAVISVSDFKYFSDAIPNHAIRNAIMFPLVVILLFAYGWGTIDARAKKTNGTTIEINGTAKQKVYIGRAGSYVFIWDSDTEEIEVIAESLMTSMKYKIPKEKPPFMALFETNKSEDTTGPNKNIQPTPEGAPHQLR